jgi:hypothetical protein
MKTELHEPGVYLNMPAEEYHADIALGSTNIRDLVASPRRFWERSWMNPARDLYIGDETDATQLGTALHCRLLEGRDVFTRRYMRRPDDAAGASTGQKSATTKKANADAAAAGRISLHGNEWTLCEQSNQIITEHEDLKDIFTGGLHEVSVFWRSLQDVPMKVRFDVLKPKAIADIKSIAPRDAFTRLESAAKMRIKYAKYHIQAEHYLEGRRKLAGLVKDERCFNAGGPLGRTQISPSLDLLKACAAQKAFAYVLVFLHKSIPECWGGILSPGNDLLIAARDQIDTAVTGYVRARQQFGTKPWPQEWRLREIDINEMPGGEFGWN